MFCENKTYPNLLLQTLEDVPPILDPKAAPSRRSLLGSPPKLNRKHALKKTEPSRSQPQPPTAPRSLLGSPPLSLRRPGSPLALSHAFTAKHGQPSRPRTTKKPSKHKKAGRDAKAPKCSVVFNLVDIPPPEISDVVDESTRKSGNAPMIMELFSGQYCFYLNSEDRHDNLLSLRSSEHMGEPWHCGRLL